MKVTHDDVIMAFDFDRLTPGGLLYDYSKYGLHATPGAGAAAPTRQLDGSYSFDGGDYFALSGDSQARFYSVAPTGAYTALALFSQTTAATAALFGFDNAGAGGTWKGGIVVTNVMTSFVLYQFQNTAALPRAETTYRAAGVVNRVLCATVESAPRAIEQQQLLASTWTVGAFGTCVMDTAQVPRIGMRPAGAYAFTGRLYYLCLLRGSASSSDLSELSALMMGGFKPWCTRP